MLTARRWKYRVFGIPRLLPFYNTLGSRHPACMTVTVRCVSSIFSMVVRCIPYLINTSVIRVMGKPETRRPRFVSGPVILHHIVIQPIYRDFFYSFGGRLLNAAQ